MTPPKFAQGIVALLLGFMRLSLQQEYAGYIFENGEYSYKIVLASDDRRTWYEAEEICREHEGGHLVTITDEAENSFLNKKIQLLSNSPSEPEQLWIGAKEEEQFGKAYRWADGHKFQYSAAFWASDGRNVGRDYEMCIVIKSTGDLADWIEADCYETKGYICKIKGVPRRLVDHKRFGYEFDSGRYIYKFIFLQYDMLTWPEAGIYCREAEGGHLASVRNARESKFIEKNLRMLRNYFGFSKLWIGASDLYNESHFSWSDGTPLTYKPWIRGEPSGQHRGRKEDCAVISTDPHWAKWRDEYCLHHLPFICKIRVCNQRADIGFIVDSSGSVEARGFRKSKEFIKFLLQKFKISQSDIHVALMRFSHRATTIFGFEDYFTHSEINDAIDRMQWVKGGTRTDRALRLARNKMFLEKPDGGMSRPGIPKFLMVMTDGISTQARLTALEADALKKKGIHVMVVVVGNLFNLREALTIASSSRDVVTVRSFSRLRRIVADTKERFCGAY